MLSVSVMAPPATMQPETFNKKNSLNTLDPLGQWVIGYLNNQTYINKIFEMVKSFLHGPVTKSFNSEELNKTKQIFQVRKLEELKPCSVRTFVPDYFDETTAQQMCAAPTSPLHPILDEIEGENDSLRDRFLRAFFHSGTCKRSKRGDTGGVSFITDALGNTFGVLKEWCEVSYDDRLVSSLIGDKKLLVSTEPAATFMMNKLFGRIRNGYLIENNRFANLYRYIPDIEQVHIGYEDEDGQLLGVNLMEVTENDPRILDQRWIMTAVDFVLGNYDRHLANIMYSKEEGLVLIDNELVLNAYQKNNQCTGWNDCKFISSNMSEKFKKWFLEHLVPNYEKYLVAEREREDCYPYLKKKINETLEIGTKLIEAWKEKIAAAETNRCSISFEELFIDIPKSQGWYIPSWVEDVCEEEQS